MRILFLTLLLFAPTTALAQTSAQVGAWFDASPGLGVGGSPVGATLAVRGSTGVWWGNYDSGFLLGRSWGVGADVKVDLFGPNVRVAPSLELRRTVDLLVIGYRWRVLAGPEWDGEDLGGSLRVGGALKVRPNRYIGPTLNAEVGAAYVGGKFSPRGTVGIGVEISFPVSGREPDYAAPAPE
ncbi:MAG: hypothetical protein AB8H79_10725 [Myxococcota bacterium]